MSNTEALKALQSQRSDIDRQIRDVAKLAFREQSEALFAAYPELQSFSWTQYTPYFNDGEECVFGANTDYPRIRLAGSSEQADDEEEEEEFYPYRAQKKAEADRTRDEVIGLAVVAFLRDYSDDVLKVMFGDHVRVVVGRDGVDVDSYDHD